MKHSLFLWLAVLLAAGTNALAAPAYSVPNIHAIGAGGVSFDNRFKITGSIGQPEVIMPTGAIYRVSAGFWPAARVPAPGASACITVTCSTNLAVDCTNVALGTRVNFSPMATNRCGAHEVSIHCMPPSGSLFPPGVTLVQCTAEADGQSASCTFPVLILGAVPQSSNRLALRVTGEGVAQANGGGLTISNRFANRSGGIVLDLPAARSLTLL